jgi:DNA-binding Xre family transcriptional regulator
MTFHVVEDRKARAQWIKIVDNHDIYGRISGVAFRAALSCVNLRWLGEEVGVARTAFNNYSKPDRATIGLLRFRKICEALQIAPSDLGFEPDTKMIEEKVRALQETLNTINVLTLDREDLPWIA